jgi:NAD(P)-dependent dehydrogenase (short-subunit alcohol dehydrogenase family)
MEHPLSGRVAVVTGGSQGIGAACAEALAHAGCDLLLVAQSPERLAEAARRIHAATGRRVETCATDLRLLEGCEEAARAARHLAGRCDILVNCAGATRGGSFVQQPDEDWVEGFQLKFFGAVRMCRLLWPLLVEARGTVVNVVGGAARVPKPDFMVGGAVNAALANFSKALSEQGLADDVNVNWVLPGMTVTARLESLYRRRAEAAGRTIEEVQREAIAQQGIRRPGTPQDVADLVAFLCLPAARHIQGVGIAVDGGSTKAVF